MPVPLVNTAAFLRFIIPHAPACPDPYAALQARMAAIEFCERTLCWREIVTMPISANGDAIVCPDTATIHRIEEATHDGAILTPTQFTAAADDLREDHATGAPRYLTQTGPNTVSVYPWAAGTLRLSLFLKPRAEQAFDGQDADNPLSDRFNVAPAFLLSQHAEKIAAGALTRILFTPAQPFTDPQRAQLYSDRFDRACDSQFATSIQGQQRAPMRVKARWM